MNKILASPFLRYAAVVLFACAAAVFLIPGGVSHLLSANEFMPHATCYLRNPSIIRLNVSTDLIIGVSYVMISSTLGYLVWRASKQIPFHWMFLAFGIFIVSCGMTHFMEVWTVWKPVYWLAGYVKLITAVASLTTAIALFPLVPKIFALIESVKISEERREKLQIAHAELEKLYKNLGERTAQLETANQELEMFTYSVAHDLRAPLRGMIGMTTALKEDYAGKLDETAEMYSNRIIESSKKMDKLVNDLLSYSRISREKLELHSVDLQSAVTSALEEVGFEIQEKNANVSVEKISATVVGHPTVLVQVLSNLLSNAVKFVSPGVQPRVSVRAEEREKRIRLWVEDNGIGIAPEYQQRIFTMFERLHNSREYSGTGIGLTIVKRAIERMGGQVGLESSAGQGSRFWIEMARAN